MSSTAQTKFFASDPARSTLGPLVDREELHGRIDVGSEDASWLQSALRGMLLIRQAEETIADLVRDGQVRCPCHLGIGQEAIAVGVARWVIQGDRVFGAHRSHSHYLALGGEVYQLLAEVLGRHTGCSRGMGGSMHLISPEVNLLGTVPIVSATIPIAVGAALAARMDHGDRVGVSFFGDGATEEGVFHESMNLAATLNLPIVFVCENNLFSSHLHISLRQPNDRLARFAEAHCMLSATVDGNDVVAVSRAAHEAFAHARAGKGPAFLEAVTYRWRGHVGHREDLDVGVARADGLAQWKRRDPVRRLAEALVAARLVNEDFTLQLAREVADEVTAALIRAQQDPYPPDSALLDLVYSPENA